MNSETVVVCPELAPGAGGLADYTLRLVDRWPAAGTLRFVVPRRQEARSAGVLKQRVDEVECNVDALLALLPGRGGKVLLQYSGYGFDRWGYPRWLLRALIEWKRRSGGVLVLMLHEIWAFWPVLNKNYIVQQLHRRDIAALVRVADAVFTSTASQAEHLRNAAPGCAVEVLPVGSNIQPVRRATSERQQGVGVIFGLQATRVRVLEKMGAELKELVARKILSRIITAGAGEAAADERALLLHLELRDGFQQRGPLAEADVSELLIEAQFGISAQDDLSLTKSGTFMAYAAHGLNVISPYASPAKPEPLCWLTAPGELLQGLPLDVLRERAESLQSWQERTASWPHIAKQFASALRLGDADNAAISAAVV